MNNKLITLLGALGIIAFFLIRIITFPSRHYKMMCELNEEFKIYNISGKVCKKWHDEKNHMYEKISVQDERSRVTDYTLANDLSGLYGYLSVGDSIHKPSGTLRTLVVRGNEERYFTIDFGCKKVK